MRRIITPLTRMGAEIRARDDQFPPLTIVGAALTPIRYELPVASAQVKSCVLLAGLSARGRTSVVEVHASRDHTERALPVFGVAVEREGSCLSVAGPCSLRSADVRVPGDFSAGVFFMLAALMVQGSEIRIPRLGLNPSRTGLLTLLKHSGAAIETSDFHQGQGEPTADLTVRFSEEALERFPRSIGGEWIPNLIDEIPALAVFGVALRHGLTVVDADELRKKESDRIHAVVSNLRALGVAAEESSDGFRIPPGARFRGGKVRTFGDHRIAMAFALAGLIADEPVELDDWECSAVSFPGFFDELAAAAR
jgi:3-phosphoshikimate 1-carboxyvinyltransferase